MKKTFFDGGYIYVGVPYPYFVDWLYKPENGDLFSNEYDCTEDFMDEIYDFIFSLEGGDRSEKETCFTAGEFLSDSWEECTADDYEMILDYAKGWKL